MKSVSDELRRELTTRIQALTPEARIELGLSLGDQDAALFAAARNITTDEARSAFQRSRRLGRRTSCAAAADSRSPSRIE
jgi:hypothetical protein